MGYDSSLGLHGEMRATIHSSEDLIEQLQAETAESLEAAAVRRLFCGLTPARLVEVVTQLDVLEMMQALRKMRLRSRPANQARARRQSFSTLDTDSSSSRATSASGTRWKSLVK